MPPTGWLLIAGLAAMVAVPVVVSWLDRRAASAVDSVLPPQGAEADVPGWPTALPVWVDPVDDARAAEAATVPFPALYAGPCAGLFCGSDAVLGVTEIPTAPAAPWSPTWADLPWLTVFADWPMDGPADGVPFGVEGSAAELAACTASAVALATQPMEPVPTEEAA